MFAKSHCLIRRSQGEHLADDKSWQDSLGAAGEISPEVADNQSEAGSETKEGQKEDLQPEP